MLVTEPVASADVRRLVSIGWRELRLAAVVLGLVILPHLPGLPGHPSSLLVTSSSATSAALTTSVTNG
jgi:hypothetical protein